MLFDKLTKLIDKYSCECDNNLDLVTDDRSNDTIKKLLKKYSNCKIKSEIDDFDQSCIILFFYTNPELYNEKTIKFINEYVSIKKTLMLIVPLNFDFNFIVKNSSTANSIDAINWRDKNGNKYKDYIIIINKN